MSFPALFLAVLAAPAPQLQPRTYVSPSGHWSLRVEPLTREGTGEADYTLSGGGREAWKARHPFALSEAAVTDDGHVAGYAYVGRPKESSSGGSLRIVVLAPTGQVRLDEAHERRASGFMHQPADPRALGLFVQPELDRLVVRVADEDLNRQAQGWWAYDLTTGAPLFRERPKVTLGLEEAIRDAPAVRAVPRTPLVLVHWYRFESAAQPRATGAAFQLLDAERRPVWRLDLPHDYEVREDEAAEDRLRLEIQKRGAILAVTPGRFELRHAAENERVAYTVAEDGTGGWMVSEIAREPFDGGRSEGTQIPSYAPKLLREVTLGGPPAPPSEIRDIRAFGFDPEGRLRFVRGEPEGTSLLLLDSAGGVLRSKAVATEVGEDLAWYPLASPTWIAVASSDKAPRARAWLVDERSGRGSELSDFPGQDVTRVVALDGERFVVLSAWHTRSTMTWTLSACDRSGRLLWSVEEDFDDPSKLSSPQDVAVTLEGKVVVLDNILDALQVFSPEGRHLETIELASAWGKEPNYPSSIVPDRDGGVLIHDFDGEVALWRMALDGSVRATLDARMRGGEPREDWRRNVQVAPDGRLWTTDRHEFVRLDEEGVVDLELGSPARLEWLESPVTGALDSTFGLVLVQDQRSKAIHVFEPDGRTVRVCRPRDEDLGELDHPRMSCAAGGVTFAAESDYTNRHVRFDAEGVSHGVEVLEAQNAVFLPGSQGYWGMAGRREQKLVRIGAGGRRELVHERLADGRWWRSISDLALAADGRLAVLDLPASVGFRSAPGAPLVALFDASGAPARPFELPEGLPVKRLAYAGPWILLTDWGARGWLLDTRDGTLRALDLGKPLASKQNPSLGLAPSGDELWRLVPAARRLERFALPD